MIEPLLVKEISEVLKDVCLRAGFRNAVLLRETIGMMPWTLKLTKDESKAGWKSDDFWEINLEEC